MVNGVLGERQEEAERKVTVLLKIYETRKHIHTRVRVKTEREGEGGRENDGKDRNKLEKT